MPDKRKPGGTRGKREAKKPRAPEPIGFATMGLRSELIAATERLGWLAPTAIQRQAIPLVLEGHDLFGAAQTGTGKTGAYALPIIQKLAEAGPAPALKPHCVVIAPTRELVRQIGEEFTQLARGLPVRAMTAYGGTSDRSQKSALSEGREVLVGAPGRVLDLMRQGYLQFTRVSFCVLDEADRMFDMGFINDIKTILNHMPSRRQTLLFSATLPPEVKRLAQDHLYYPQEARVGPTAPPKELKHELWPTAADKKYANLVHLLNNEYETVLIFCRTKKGTAELARRLSREREAVAAIHADRTQKERERALARFKAGDIRVLVATDVASRGLDIEGIDLVVNYDVPHDPEDYVHRVGRTARVQRPGLAVTFVAPGEEPIVRRIESFIRQRVDRRQEAISGQGAGSPRRKRTSKKTTAGSAASPSPPARKNKGRRQSSRGRRRGE